MCKLLRTYCTYGTHVTSPAAAAGGVARGFQFPPDPEVWCITSGGAMFNFGGYGHFDRALCWRLCWRLCCSKLETASTSSNLVSL